MDSARLRQTSRKVAPLRQARRALLLASIAGWGAVVGLAAVQWWQLRDSPADDRMMAGMALIEPASGGEPPPDKGHTTANGKNLSAKDGEDDLPKVSIGSMTVTTYKTQAARVTKALLPKGLRDPGIQDELGRRFRFTPYAHNPVRGPMDAELTLVDFNDLACVQCRQDVKTADKVVADNPDRVRQVELHLPLTRYSDTNLLAFYGKVAQRGGRYWEYRKTIMDQPSESAATGDQAKNAFDALLASGVDQAEARRWLTREARRFYRELDADAALGKALGLDNPPHFYLNGIHVGDGGIPRAKVADVAQWLLQRQTYKLESHPVRLAPKELPEEETKPLDASAAAGMGASSTEPAQ